MEEGGFASRALKNSPPDCFSPPAGGTCCSHLTLLGHKQKTHCRETTVGFCLEGVDTLDAACILWSETEKTEKFFDPPVSVCFLPCREVLPGFLLREREFFYNPLHGFRIRQSYFAANIYDCKNAFCSTFRPAFFTAYFQNTLA